MKHCIRKTAGYRKLTDWYMQVLYKLTHSVRGPVWIYVGMPWLRVMSCDSASENKRRTHQSVCGFLGEIVYPLLCSFAFPVSQDKAGKLFCLCLQSIIIIRSWTTKLHWRRRRRQKEHRRDITHKQTLTQRQKPQKYIMPTNKVGITTNDILGRNSITPLAPS